MRSVKGLSPEQLTRALDVGRALVTNLDTESLLREVLTAAEELTDARYSALGVLDAEKRVLERFLFRGIDEETRQRIGPLPRGHGLLGELIRHPEPLRLARISDHPRSYGFPAGHPPMTSFLGCPVRIRGEVFGNIYLTDKRSATGFSEADAQLLEVLAEWAAIAIENARSHERLDRRRAELERAVRGLQATTELSREAERETSVDRVLELVVKRGRALADARACAVLLHDEGALRVASAAGEMEERCLGSSLAAPRVTVEAVRAGASQRLEGDAAARLLPAGFEPRAALLAPLRARGSSFGVLVALDRIGPEPVFEADDELVFASFAVGAAGAIAATRAHVDEKLRLAMGAADQERRRWARELHDETLQELGALRLAQAAALSHRDLDGIRRAVAVAAEQVDRIIAGLHEVIAELRPAALDDLGVAAAVETLVERVEERFGLDVSVDVDLAFEGGREEARPSPELEATLYRVVQEALTNVGKHAGADAARVAVDERDGAITVTVEDDGAGIATDPGLRGNGEGGFGLIGMRERVALLGGELRVGPGSAGGTRVVAVIPVTRPPTGPGGQRSTSPFSSA